MLTIRTTQRRALRRGYQNHFKHRLSSHVRKFFSSQCQQLDETELNSRIEAALARAATHGFATERALCRYLDLTFAFGPEFDRTMPWAAATLNEGPENATIKLDLLCQQALHQLKTSAGGGESQLDGE